VVSATDLIFAVLFVGVLYIIAGPLAFIPLVMLPIMIAVGLTMQRPLDRAMKRLQADHGLTYIVISHDLAVVKYMADRIGVMYLGRVVELAGTESLVADPAHPYSAALIAAIPEADPDITRSKRRVELRSAEIPSLLRLPSGCTFHPRCPLFEAGLCDVKVPELLPIPGAREVACHVAVRERTSERAAAMA